LALEGGHLDGVKKIPGGRHKLMEKVCRKSIIRGLKGQIGLPNQNKNAGMGDRGIGLGGSPRLEKTQGGGCVYKETNKSGKTVTRR